VPIAKASLPGETTVIVQETVALPPDARLPTLTDGEATAKWLLCELSVAETPDNEVYRVALATLFLSTAVTVAD
jgi:hypothetical protein